MKKRKRANLSIDNEEREERKHVVKQAKRKLITTNRGILLPTGIDLLDLVCGGGNMFGRIINIVGDKSSGKSFLASEIVAFAKKILGNKLKWYYDDAEGGYSFDTMSMYGFNMIDEDARPSSTVEEFGSRVMKYAQALGEDEYFIYVLDSLDGLSSRAERSRDKRRQQAEKAGKEFDEGSYGMDKQKFLSEFFRLRAGEIKHKKFLLIVVSQVRDNIGVMFGEKHRRAGGKALDFYAYLCLWLSEVQKVYKKKRVIGVTVKAKAKKAKIKKPYRECFFELIFDYGIDNIQSNINFLYDLKTDLGKDKTAEKSDEKEKLDWQGTKYSKARLIKHIEENNLEAELTQMVVEKWEEIEESISSEGRRKNKWK